MEVVSVRGADYSPAVRTKARATGPRGPSGRRSSELPSKFVLIDAHNLSREGISRLLVEHMSGAQIEDGVGIDALKQRGRLNGATAVLYVVRPGHSTVRQSLSELASVGLLNGEAVIVLLSERWEMADVRLALVHGVRGCISLAENSRILAAALRLVVAGGVYVPPESLDADVAQALPPSRPAPGGDRRNFTPQEQKVLDAILEGKSNKRIARDLELCESTVKVHVRHIMRKMSVSNRTQVALSMMRDGGPREASGPANNGACD